MDAATLYDDDIVDLGGAAGGRPARLAARPELSNAVDWENIIEEIECLGRSEWKGVESQLINALAHILKGFCDSGSPIERALGDRDRQRPARRPQRLQELDAAEARHRRGLAGLRTGLARCC